MEHAAVKAVLATPRPVADARWWSKVLGSVSRRWRLSIDLARRMPMPMLPTSPEVQVAAVRDTVRVTSNLLFSADLPQR